MFSQTANKAKQEHLATVPFNTNSNSTLIDNATPAGPSTIPTEIFFLIIETLVNEAAETARPQVWTLAVNHVTNRIALIPCDLDHPDPFPPIQLAGVRDRYNSIRLVSQINKASRAIVRRTFLRFPMAKGKLSKFWGINAWFLPDVDYVRPGLWIKRFLAVDSQRERRAARNTALISAIRKVNLAGPAMMKLPMSSTLLALLQLPSLKEISIVADLNKHYAKRKPNGRSFRRHRSAPILDLSSWKGGRLGPHWKQFEERGIRLFAVHPLSNGYFLEVLTAPDGSVIFEKLGSNNEASQTIETTESSQNNQANQGGGGDEN